MAKNENKTQRNDADVQAFLARAEPARRRDEAQVLLDLMTRATSLEPAMWGDSIVGFGQYHYVYESGREGDHFLVGFAPRKANMVIYIMPGFSDYEKQLAKLGKHKKSVSCLYLGRLANVDMKVLKQLIEKSVKHMRKKYNV